MAFFIVTTVKTSNLTHFTLFVFYFVSAFIFKHEYWKVVFHILWILIGRMSVIAEDLSYSLQWLWRMLLEYDPVESVRSLPMFQSNVLCSSLVSKCKLSKQKHSVCCLIAHFLTQLTLWPWRWGSTFLQNPDKLQEYYIVPLLRRQIFSLLMIHHNINLSQKI
jgi:hypothetical protein